MYMQNFLRYFSPFTQTRLILSAWYTFILSLILIAFSIALSITYNNDVTRIVLQQDFGNHVPRTLSRTELRLVLAQVRALRYTSRLDIIVIDIITIFIGGALSFFLAGKTLKPIQKSLVSQKVFIADASHELKSPVTVIQSACEVALRSSTKSKEDYKQVLITVHEQSLRIGKLINDLLSLSVLDAGSTKELKPCSLSSIAQKEIENMQPIAIKDKIILKTNIESDVNILGDTDSLQKLIIILLDNALKFTPAKGKVNLTVTQKPLPSLTVSDTGMGIALQKQKDIFKRFYQADDSHAGKGAGLGLSIAEAIMQMHKGRITLESWPGKGSTFTCIFPKYQI